MLKAERSSLESNSTITNKFGDRPPSTYSIKIQSLSQLVNLFPNEAYKSRTFSSGKLNWRLVIYPKGNAKDNGGGFVSMYVELDSTSLGSSALAYLTFFVYNKKENKYFTIQDVERKQFNALRPVWGLPQVLPLDTFSDPKNGYVYEGDQCEFGVDVMIPLTNWEVVSFEQKPPNPKVSWTVNKFSKLKEHCYVYKFLIGGRNWEIMLFPKGYDTTHCNSLSIFLHFADDKTVIKAGEQIYTGVEIRILDPFGCNHLKRKLNRWHVKPLACGWRNFLSLATLGAAYLDKEGSLKLEIEFKVVSTNKYST